jgi:hypothetical protein
MESQMRFTVFLSCLVLASSAFAQTQPKVVFVTDVALSGWLQSPSFTSNPNWIVAPIGVASGVDPHAFQISVINQHPAYVFIDVGTDRMTFIGGSAHGIGDNWGAVVSSLEPIVQMAQAARIKVILGNIAVAGPAGDLFNSWLQTYSSASNIPVVNFEYWLQNGCYGVVATPASSTCTLAIQQPLSSGEPGLLTPTPLAYQFMTQMATTAIATYGLTMKGGYLANVLTIPEGDPQYGFAPAAQVNTVEAGSTIQFTPQATWSDGVTRPMLNSPYGEAQGIWWSTNPNMLTVTQQGMAFAYSPLPLAYPSLQATAQVWFKSSTGHTFSPWGMTVYQPKF